MNTALLVTLLTMETCLAALETVSCFHITGLASTLIVTWLTVLTPKPIITDIADSLGGCHLVTCFAMIDATRLGTIWPKVSIFTPGTVHL